MKFSEEVYQIVRRIPPGQTLTYGQVARLAGNGEAARAVGNILHRNPDPDSIPCHRVVNAAGQPAKNYAFGGAEGQLRKLRQDHAST